ncbi:MAG: HD domain-containing phosphohydrolase [Candidatus Ratteibacteria bacterium]
MFNRLRRLSLPAIFILWAVLFISGKLETPRLSAYDFLLKQFPGEEKEAPILLIGVTEKFNHYFNHEANRNDYRKALKILTEEGVKSITFDLFFASLRTPEEDRAFANALSHSPNPILPVFTSTELSYFTPQTLSWRARNLQENHPLFQRHVSLGHINTFVNKDKLIRKLPAFLSYKASFYPLISLKTLELYQNSPVRTALSTWQAPASDTIPLDEDGCIAIRFLSKKTLERHFLSIENLLLGNYPQGFLRNKAIILGQTSLGAKNADLIPTPLGVQFGASIQFQALYTLFTRSFIRTIGTRDILSIAFIFTLLLMLIFLLPLGKATSILILLFSGYSAGTIWLFKSKNIFLDPSPLFFIGIIAYVIHLFFRLIEIRRELFQREHLLSALEQTQKEIASLLKPGELPGAKRTFSLPSQDILIEKTPEITIRTINTLLGVSEGYLIRHHPSQDKEELLAASGGKFHPEFFHTALSLAGPSHRLILNKHLPPSLAYKKNLMLIDVLNDPPVHIYGLFLNKKPTSFSPRRSFTPSDYQWTLSFALQTVIAVFHSQFNLVLKKSQLETIFRLAISIEYRHRETGKHINRVSEYAAIIARNLGLNEFETDLIKSAMPLHDLGKIAIADSILLKPSSLTDKERAIVNQHTIMGAKILENSDSLILQAAYIIALYHHEKFDGTGYPYGLKGTAIPLYGRIGALADVFDALCSERVYKSAHPIEDALQMVQQWSGTHFDPTVLEAFLKDKPLIHKIYETYKETPDHNQNTANNTEN